MTEEVTREGKKRKKKRLNSLNNHLKPLQPEKSGFILRKQVPFLWQDTDIQWPIRLIIGCLFGGSELLLVLPTQASCIDTNTPSELISAPPLGAAALALGAAACMPMLPELFQAV